MCPPAHLSSEKVLPDPCPSGTYISSSWSVDLLVWLRYFSICCFCAETRSKWVCGVSLCISPSRATSVSHSLPALPDIRPLGFQSLALLRAFICLVSFPWLGSPVWGLTPLFLSSDLCGCWDILLLVDHHTEDWVLTLLRLCPSNCHNVALILYF